MKRYLYIFILFALCRAPAFSQEQLSNRLQADKLFERYEYFRSLNLYLPLADKAKADTKLLERIADCYRYINNYPEAEKWYSRAVSSEDVNPKSTYYYAEALVNNQKFSEAKVQFRKYFAGGNPKALQSNLASIDSAMLWIKQVSGYKVTNLKPLNSMYADWGLSYSGSTALVFVSDRNLALGTYNRTGNGWLKPYIASVDDKPLGQMPLNVADRHVGPIAFNATEDTAYVTVSSQLPVKNLKIEKGTAQNLVTRRLEIIITEKANGRWRAVSKFPYNNVNEYSVGHAALSSNGQTLYFTSDMPGGEGGTDIWYCGKRADGTWDKPVNCGKAINTVDDEAFPEINGNGGLYFSSKGLEGMGGYDIFFAIGEKANWEKPSNLKYPVNSTADDFCFITHDGISGYLSSNRAGGMGNDDIYRFSYALPKPEQKPIARAPLPANGNTPLNGKLEPGKSYVLRNIYYDLDKSEIRPDAAIELDKLADILQQNAGIRIELSSHTDSRASDAYNMGLSQRRAEAAVAYLISKGVRKERLQAHGYGETRLLNRCANGIECAEAEHQANRRTEVKVLE